VLFMPLRALTESLARSFVLLHASEHLGVLTVSIDRVLDANDAFLKMTGHTREELQEGQIDWRAMTPAEHIPRYERGLEDLRQKGLCPPFEQEYILSNGRRLPVLVGAVRISTEPLQWVSWVVGLFPQKQALELERQSRELAAELEAELKGAFRIFDITSRMLHKTDVKDLLIEVLDAAIQVTGADFGNMQLQEDGVLRIVVQRNLPDRFLEFFQAVTADKSAVCAAALRSLARVIVQDVATDPLFRGSVARDMLLDTGIRAVQSTPLFGAGGHFYGMLSTHFRRPTRPDELSLRYLDLVAVRAGQMLDALKNAELERKLEGMRASATLANHLAHEINNPLQGLANILELLDRDQALQEQARPLLAMANEQLARVAKKVQELLAVDSKAPQRGTQTALTELIDEMRDEYSLAPPKDRKMSA
jgi:PAS domain S-box-containing protein